LPLRKWFREISQTGDFFPLCNTVDNETVVVLVTLRQKYIYLACITYQFYLIVFFDEQENSSATGSRRPGFSAYINL